MIRIENLSKRYGRATVVDGMSLSISPGESVALWGTNGAGKTTIIRCVLGLLRCRGKISIGGLDARRKGKRARMLVGYVPQELGFYDDMGVTEAVAFFAHLKRVRVGDIDKTLDQVGLRGHGHKRIRELSGGMKQRLALAVALLGDPPVLILDEVTASLDACGREELVALLSKLAKGGRTLLFASHRIDEVTTLASRIVMLDRGRCVADVPVTDFLPRLGHEAVLHLHMHTNVRQRATDLLRSCGYEASLNGVGILVPVPADQKAAPLQLLSEARVRVDDFEVLIGKPASREVQT